MTGASIYDAVVIGGGPAGATAALLLARAGWSVAVIEKSCFPRRKVCGEFISATSLPLLYDHGIRDEYLAQAGPEIRRVGFYAHDAVIESPMPNAASSVAGWGRALGREHLDVLLLDAAVRAGATLFQPYKALGLENEDRGVICRIASDDIEKELRARVGIIAHGSWERSVTGEELPLHKASDLLAFKAHFKDSILPAGLMPLLVFPGGYGGLVHTDGGRVSLSCCIRRDRLRQCRDERKGLSAADAVLAHIADNCTGVRDALGPARRDGAFLSAGPIRPGIRRRYRNRIFAVGNAAGEAHPVVAEGISMAMQSAWLLCQYLAAAQTRLDSGAIDGAGEAYSAAWKSAFAPRIRAAALFAHFAMRPKLAGLAQPVLTRFPAMLTLGAWLSGKTTQIVPA